MAHEIAVWQFAEPVGTLPLVAGRLGLRYGANWLGRPNALALSQSLPLQSEPFDDHQRRAFFAGLLPEGNLRRLIAQQCQVSSQNDFALLNAIGGEIAGAITFVPAEQPLSIIEQSSVEWLDEPQLMSMLDELPRRPMLAGRDGIRLSLAGAQAKKRILRIAQYLPAAARNLQESQSFADQQVIARIVALIEQRAALTVNRLTKGASDIEEEEINER